jgi:DNA-binding winged helix-turn-helix (wHTH) protein
MRVRVLGRPALSGDRGAVALPGEREAGILAVLAANLGRTVRAETIEDELWDGRRVSEATLRVAVNRLRKRAAQVSGVELIRSEPSGYRLVAEPGEVDAVEVDEWVKAARDRRLAGDLDGALAA